jgi:hypothetical protein
MLLTIEVSPELEAQLRAEAACQGLAADDYARRLLEESLRGSKPQPFYGAATPEEWEASFDCWLDSHDAILPPLPESALRRESFYGERG